MSPKEKALQLYNRMIVDFKIDKWQSQQCALVAVDEIIESRNLREDPRFDDSDFANTYSGYHTPHPMYLSYWEQVKQEIEKL